MDLSVILNTSHLALLLILLQGSCTTQAQFWGPPPPSDETGSILAAIFGTIAVIFFVVLFSLCFYRRMRQYINGISTIRPGAGTAQTTTSETGERHRQKGIDHSVLDTFPIMEYAAVQKLAIDKGPLECAVCLSEFADDGSLKLLPGCCHVFHPECIDQWLENHITCPVCRADLSNPTVTSDSINATSEGTGIGTITTEENVVRPDGGSGGPSEVIHTADRFTLRLPHHVIKEIEEARKHRRSVSVAGYSYERRGSIIGRSGRLRGFIRSFSSVLQREPHASELPMNTRSIGLSSLSGENQDQRSPSNASPIALLAGYDRS